MSISIGIDLGTTNSVLAFTNLKANGDIVSKVVEVSRPVDMYSSVSGSGKLSIEKKPTLPSCVYYVEEKGYAPIVGDFAKMQYSVRPHLVAKSIKSQMGNPKAQGLSPDISDKTPAQISSQILKHMLKEASRSLKTEINDAIITVPANFDSAMCQATIEAAELAGIKVKKADGSERPILLSEPNAVIYDLFNQIRNGEIPPTILELNEPKRVIVFDLGGGTLDITMHEIRKRNETNDGTLKVSEIATNRYTLLGGDDFDQVIAESMFSRYVEQYRTYPEQAASIRQRKNDVMPQLRTYAENLKIELNDHVSSGCDEESLWEDESDTFPVGGNIYNTGYAYDDSFTKEEIEKILSVFMADDLVYDDYKRIGQISNTRNIIFPILDVLYKAGKKLHTDNVKVDAVIVNGGMSKFYMVTDRLTKFFGFEPIVLLDPDQSVARGAAVYHYLMTHNSEELADDMKKVDTYSSSVPYARSNTISSAPLRVRDDHINIEWGKNILNDSLYLGMRNGVNEEIVPTGVELPYTSEVKKGFQIEPGQNTISLSIKSRNLDGSFRTIAQGRISFSRSYPQGAFVAFCITMNTNKVLTINAWTHSGPDASIKQEIGTTSIAVDNSGPSVKKSPGGKIIPPTGSRLDPKAEINSLVKLCENYQKVPQNRKNISARIRVAITSICTSSNADEFAPVILKALQTNICDEAKMRLFIIARRMVSYWSENDRKKLAELCLCQLAGAVSGFTVYGSQRNVNIQAIYALAFCGTKKELNKLVPLHNLREYFQSCLYAHAISKTNVDWIMEEFLTDVQRFRNSSPNNIQFSAYSLGYALNGYSCADIAPKQIENILHKTINIINSGSLSAEQLTSCILALGWICDQRANASYNISEKTLGDAKRVLDRIDSIYEYETARKSSRVKEIAYKLIEGRSLDDDEKLLLEKIFPDWA